MWCWKCCMLLFLLMVTEQRATAQITWQQRPSDYQLFPRNQQNLAEIHLKGQLTDSLIQSLQLVCMQSNGRTDTQTWHTGGIGVSPDFHFKDTLIASLNDYSYKLYAVRTNGTQLLWEARHVCCGDVYLIAGQSNALGHLNPDSLHDPPPNPYVRTFGRPSAMQASDFQADTSWGLGLASTPDTNFHHLVGHLGFHLGDSLVKRWGVPVCILNVAMGATSIAKHQKVAGAEDLNRIYDRMLYRCRLAGIQESVRAIVWYQGESDESTLTKAYTQSFKQLYSSWRQDFPVLRNVYLYQIGHGCGNLYTSSLREEMRQMKLFDPSVIRVLSTMNIPHDGCHFYSDGYRKLAHQLLPLIAQDVFGEVIHPSEQAPDLLRAAYKEARQLMLLFDQPVQFDAFDQDHFLGDYFFNESDVSGFVRSVHAKADTVLLELIMDYPFRNISYTPECTYQRSTQVYQGPYIYNEKGWGAFTFDEVPVVGYRWPSTSELLLLFPNPVSEGQNVSIVSNTPYVIRDLSGRPVNQEFLRRGVYVVCNQQGTCQQLLVW